MNSGCPPASVDTDPTTAKAFSCGTPGAGTVAVKKGSGNATQRQRLRKGGSLRSVETQRKGGVLCQIIDSTAWCRSGKDDETSGSIGLKAVCLAVGETVILLTLSLHHY